MEASVVSTVKRGNRLSRSDWTNIELFRIRESSSRIASSEIVSSLDSLATTLFPIAIRTKPSESKRTPPLDPVKIRSPPAKIGAVWYESGEHEIAKRTHVKLRLCLNTASCYRATSRLTITCFHYETTGFVFTMFNQMLCQSGAK